MSLRGSQGKRAQDPEWREHDQEKGPSDEEVALLELIRFTVIRHGRILDESGDLLERKILDELTDEISDLLMNAAGVDDQSIEADLATGEVTMSVDVEAPGPLKALEIGDGAIRSTLHAAMVATPSWEVNPDEVVLVQEEASRAMLEGGSITIEPADLIDA